MQKEQIMEKLAGFFGFDGNHGTYYHVLTRSKEAYHYGTMSLDDFQELDDEFLDELADFIIKEIGL